MSMLPTQLQNTVRVVGRQLPLNTVASGSNVLRLARPVIGRLTSIQKLQLQKRGFLTIVEQGHEGWRLTLGRNPVRLSPGLNLYIPVWHQVQKLDLRESSVNIPNLQGYTADNVPVLCSGSMFYRIRDSYKACFEVSEVDKNVQNIGTSAMRSVLGTFSYDQVIADRNELNQRLNKVIGDSIAQWGVECTKFEIQSFQPANREIERQLELQMEAERNRRKQTLDTKAAINIAEGHKQRVILESEGLLEAKSNEADAAYKTVVRDAEARQQQALMEASAIAKQVEAISRSLAPDSSTEPSTEHRLTALQMLVELKRLDQLKAIASSDSNSTYFFGDKAALGAGLEGAGGSWGVDYAQNVKDNMQKASNAESQVSIRTNGLPGAAARAA
ncbi:hypothetical protein CPB83DRAFT_854791 [Crepidotus variabilis]|uniref:Band 7 domain-containing protein n=1 Tax=Crepidotus variabilis TaxID=179855 RepID=A0A9P6JQ62_9AGAR|nr:hypothetical protein CPB83DRAFT_854791 [Crepidotus variabilis]